jgi:CDP-4-dehydro-6-deoxyglucose reductase, E3
MPYGNYKLKVASKKELAPNILLLSVTGDKEASNFLGGQYYSFKVGEKINRSYSIASGPLQDTVEFVVDVTPGGPGSVFVEALNESDTFDTMGPFGFFTLEKTKAADDENPLIFIATGTGIAPFRSMILDLLKNKKTNREITLYFGLRYENEAYFFEEFSNLAAEFSNFTFIPVVSRPTESWTGAKGHCQDLIMAEPIDPTAKIYICGRTETVIAMAGDLVAYGYPKENVFFEKFG